MSARVVILDTETTGKDDPGILSFHALGIHAGISATSHGDMEYGFEIPSPDFPLYILPDADQLIHPEAYLVNGLTTDVIRERYGIKAFDAAVILHRWFTDMQRSHPTFAAWNARFDFDALNLLFERNLLPRLFVNNGENPPKQIDLMPMHSVMSLLRPDVFPPTTITSEDGKRTYISRKLGDAFTAAKLVMTGVKAHDVVADVEKLAGGVYELMWQTNPRMMRVMIEGGDKIRTRQLLRQDTDDALFYFNTTGQVAYGQGIVTIPLPDTRDKSNKPWHERRKVVAINLESTDIAKLAKMSVEELCDLIRPPKNADGTYPLRRAFNVDDVPLLLARPLVVLDMDEHLILLDRAAQRGADLKISKTAAAPMQALAHDSAFQQRVHAAVTLAFPDNPEYDRPSTAEAKGARAAAAQARRDFHATNSWNKRAEIMRRMTGEDRIHALRIIHTHQPDVLSQGECREWHDILFQRLSTEFDDSTPKYKRWVTLPEIERSIAAKLANPKTPPAVKDQLRAYKRCEIPKVNARLVMQRRAPSRNAAPERATL